jgi:D-alanyl-D-alanine carboxypeptidase
MAGRAILIALCWLAAAGGVSHAATPALVVDAQTGRVLHADRATDPWYPASITKLMTAYVALDAVRQGRMSMSSLLTLSAEAAAQPPSKMGFKPGTQLTLENALKIIMVKSANDIANMIGENVGGSIEGFAVMMNDASRRLGMYESRWYNPSGLPDDRQQTSARDMAILARALLREFPERESLFQIGAVKLGPKVLRNHNGLLGRYPGADGMKTGFICSGGFNVVASATQNGRRLITVVMGYGSARERDLRAADLFDLGFATAGWTGQQVESLPPSSVLSPPNMRPFVCGGKRQPEADEETALVASRDPPGGNAENSFAALFSPSGFATAPANIPALGSRRDLGPRVAFEPVPIWLGATPGTIADGSDVKARPTGIAARPVRTKALARAGALPASARAFAPTPTDVKIIEERSVETLKTAARPGGRTALQDNLKPKPVAETKPRPGAIGSAPSGRPKLGAIEAKPLKASAAVSGVNPGTGPAAAVAKPKADPKKAAPKPDAKRAQGR